MLVETGAGTSAISGFVFYDCTGPNPAFATSASTGSVTPTFTLPSNTGPLVAVPVASPYTSLPAITGTNCATQWPTNAVTLTSGSVVSITSPASGTSLGTSANYDYCLDFGSGTSSVGTWTISWSQ